MAQHTVLNLAPGTWRATYYQEAPSTRYGSTYVRDPSMWTGRLYARKVAVWQARTPVPCYVCDQMIAAGEHFTKRSFPIEHRHGGFIIDSGPDGTVGHSTEKWVCGFCRPGEASHAEAEAMPISWCAQLILDRIAVCSECGDPTGSSLQTRCREHEERP